MPDFADDTKTELQRKAEQLQVVALIDTISYAILFVFWIVLANHTGKVLMGWFHGWITVAFAVMVVWIWPSMKWRWYWIALAAIPVAGGVLVYEKIRRDGAPDGHAALAVQNAVSTSTQRTWD